MDRSVALSPALSGFENINRYWDKSQHMVVAKILPGELYVSKTDESITTVLGSCISACIWDSVMGVGGMNHFMLPQANANNSSAWRENDSYSCRYGNWAIEFLINEILKNGGNRKNLQAKIFGGGKILNSMTDVGMGNIGFAITYLESEGIEIVSKDVGGPWPRKVLFEPITGRARVRKLKQLHNDTIERRERAYLNSLQSHEEDSNIELF